MHEVLVNRLGGLSLPKKSVVRLTDRPEMTLDVYRGRKTTTQQQPYIFIRAKSVVVSSRNIAKFRDSRNWPSGVPTVVVSCPFQKWLPTVFELIQ